MNGKPYTVWIVETNAGIVGVYGSEDVAKAMHQAPDWTQRLGGQYSAYLHTRLICWEVMTGVHITDRDGTERTVT